MTFVFLKKKFFCVCFKHQASPPTEISTTKLHNIVRKKRVNMGHKSSRKNFFFLLKLCKQPNSVKKWLQKVLNLTRTHCGNFSWSYTIVAFFAFFCYYTQNLPCLSEKKVKPTMFWRLRIGDWSFWRSFFLMQKKFWGTLLQSNLKRFSF